MKCFSQNTHFVFSNFPPPPENRAVYWKIQCSVSGHRWPYGACVLLAGYLRLQTHPEYVLLITVPLQQWLHERVSVLRYTYVGCLEYCTAKTNRNTHTAEEYFRKFFGQIFAVTSKITRPCFGWTHNLSVFFPVSYKIIHSRSCDVWLIYLDMLHCW